MIVPESFLKLVKELSSNNDSTSEIQRRNNIRLVYYFFYHKCIEVLRSELPELKKKKFISHREFRYILTQYTGNNKFLINANKDSAIIWKYRVLSDYNLLYTVKDDLLEYALEIIDRYNGNSI